MTSAKHPDSPIKKNAVHHTPAFNSKTIVLCSRTLLLLCLCAMLIFCSAGVAFAATIGKSFEPFLKNVDPDSAKMIWEFLTEKLDNDYGAAGLMGNLYAESELRANNLQNTNERGWGTTDEEYTTAVDDGTYKGFASDSAGYGLAQWTYITRKQRLLDYATQAKASIGDLEMQLNFLWKELSEGYPGIVSALQQSESVYQASNVVLLWYERPADQSWYVQETRASYGQWFYDQYQGPNSPIIQ